MILKGFEQHPTHDFELILRNYSPISHCVKATQVLGTDGDGPCVRH